MFLKAKTTELLSLQLYSTMHFNTYSHEHIPTREKVSIYKAIVLYHKTVFKYNASIQYTCMCVLTMKFELKQQTRAIILDETMACSLIKK